MIALTENASLKTEGYGLNRQLLGLAVGTINAARSLY